MSDLLSLPWPARRPPSYPELTVIALGIDGVRRSLIGWEPDPSRRHGPYGRQHRDEARRARIRGRRGGA
jgi:hypothetical protein